MVSLPLGIGGVGINGLGFPRNVHLQDDVKVPRMLHSMVQAQWHEGMYKGSLSLPLFQYRMLEEASILG